MKLNAGLDPIIALLVGVGWFIVRAIMNRREDSDSWGPSEQAAPPPHVPERNHGVPPRRIEKPSPHALPPPATRPYYLPEKPKPIVRPAAPAPPPVIVATTAPVGQTQRGRLVESQQSYARAEHLQQSVATRLSAIDQRTEHAKPTTPKSRGRSAAAAHVLRTFRNPATVRQAFLASFVLNPPKALE